MTATTCPKCGRQVTESIHVPLSQSNGITTRRCTCGQELVYKPAGFDAREAKRREIEFERQFKERLDKNIFEKFGILYGTFAFCLVLFALCSSVYLLVVHIQNRAFITGILLFLGSLGLLVTITFVYLMEQIEYPKDRIPDEADLRQWRVITHKTRMVGVKIGLALSAVSLLLGWYGGIFPVLAKLEKGVSYMVTGLRYGF